MGLTSLPFAIVFVPYNLNKEDGHIKYFEVKLQFTVWQMGWLPKQTQI